MKTVIINEIDELNVPNAPMLDLRITTVKDCIGCWSCWWATPGRCIHKDLDGFYRDYLKADKAIFLAKLNRGFISGNLKTLFDRIIPLFLPYCIFKNGGTMHSPRYERYPDIEFYYDGEFEDDEHQKIFIDYICKVFQQFYSKNILIEPISNFCVREE